MKLFAFLQSFLPRDFIAFAERNHSSCESSAVGRGSPGAARDRLEVAAAGPGSRWRDVTPWASLGSGASGFWQGF